METSVPGEFPAQRPVTRSFDVFLDLHPNKRLSKSGEACDLRRHRVHYDVTVMNCWYSNSKANLNYDIYIFQECFARHKYQRQGQVITAHSICGL